jgi:hypothetical protein
LTENRWLALILILFTVLGITYAVVTPIFEASDELWHYPMVRHLADGNPLPVQVFDPSEAGPWKQEASQPPLYYYLGAALTFWIDASDMEDVRWLNPHVDNGVITEDGNLNLVIHDPNTSPWQGASLAIRIVRLASVFLGTITVYLTFRIAKAVAPERPDIYLGAAAINAFLPMFLFISGAVNNDNLVITLASLSLLLIIKMATSETPVSLRREYAELALLGAIIGLGALTKITALGLLALALVGIGTRQWMRYTRCRGASENTESKSPEYAKIILSTLGRFAILLLPVLLIAGWWYIRNIQLYGDWSGWNAFIAVLGQRATPANLAQLWDERWGFMISFWGMFGGLNVPMANWIYQVLNILVVLSAIGFVIYIVRLVIAWWSNRRKPGNGFGISLRNLFDFIADNIALFLCVLWVVAVIVGLVNWATVTWSSQGRLVFSSISALSTILMVGLVGWFPGRIGKYVVVSIAGIFFAISALAPFIWIQPAYQDMSDGAGDLRIANANFDNALRLQGYSINNESIMPGDSLDVVVEWEVLQEMDRDWSVFVHLNDPQIELPAAQRDMYPGQGLRPTSLLSPGERIIDRYVLQVPETAITPALLELTVGLYDFGTGERMLVQGGGDSVILDTIALTARPGDIPNPVSINFEDVFELVGFSLEPRRLSPGENIELNLVYVLMKEVSENYTFFVQVVGDDTTRWASQDLSQPTSVWQPGEVQKVSFTLNLAEALQCGSLVKCRRYHSLLTLRKRRLPGYCQSS